MSSKVSKKKRKMLRGIISDLYAAHLSQEQIQTIGASPAGLRKTIKHLEKTLQFIKHCKEEQYGQGKKEANPEGEKRNTQED